MTTKHTPGPWVVDDDDGSIRTESGDEVLVSYGDGEGHSLAATHADRMLVAAAPDLLGACEEALEAFADLGIDETMPMLHGRIRAAIAKAKGETK